MRASVRASRALTRAASNDLFLHKMASVRASRALTRAASSDLFLHKMASAFPVLLIERHAPGVRLYCLLKNARNKMLPKFLT